MTQQRQIVVGMSGASGQQYGLRLVELLLQLDYTVHLMLSAGAGRVLQEECNLPKGAATPVEELFPGLTAEQCSRLIPYNNRDIAAGPASGTFKAAAMVIIPASMKTLAGLASGYTDNLLLRAGDVFLKERHPLVIVPRETPLSLIHVRNMETLLLAGAHLLPAMPGFYHQPKSLEDLYDFMAMKVLDVLGIRHDIPHAWSGPRRSAGADGVANGDIRRWENEGGSVKDERPQANASI